MIKIIKWACKLDEKRYLISVMIKEIKTCLKSKIIFDAVIKMVLRILLIKLIQKNIGEDKRHILNTLIILEGNGLSIIIFWIDFDLIELI